MEALSEGLNVRMPDFKLVKSSKRQVLGVNEFMRLGVLFAGALLAVTMGIAFYGAWWAGVVFIPYSVIFIKKNLKLLSGRSRRKNEEEFIDGITALTFALQAGYSVENSFAQAADELNKLHGRSVMADEFKSLSISRKSIKWCGTSFISNFEGLAVPISICRYICIRDGKRRKSCGRYQEYSRSDEGKARDKP